MCIFCLIFSCNLLQNPYTIINQVIVYVATHYSHSVRHYNRSVPYIMRSQKKFISYKENWKKSCNSLLNHYNDCTLKGMLYQTNSDKIKSQPSSSTTKGIWYFICKKNLISVYRLLCNVGNHPKVKAFLVGEKRVTSVANDIFFWYL